MKHRLGAVLYFLQKYILDSGGWLDDGTGNLILCIFISSRN